MEIQARQISNLTGTALKEVIARLDYGITSRAVSQSRDKPLVRRTPTFVERGPS
jgi:hypothetical protein